jgi:hypothetical protein
MQFEAPVWSVAGRLIGLQKSWWAVTDQSNMRGLEMYEIFLEISTLIGKEYVDLEL